MSEHTPGPWVWWTSNSWKRLKTEHMHTGANVLEPYVCGDGHPDLIVSDSDMALMRAAPDLLEALESIENDDCSIPTAIWDMVTAAIAKARGKI